MANSSKIFVLTLVTLAAAASAGATMWISRRRCRPSDDSSAEPALPASSADTDAPPAAAASAPATTTIIRPAPILIRRRQEGLIPILPFRSFSVPPFSILLSSLRQFINVTDSPAMTAIMVRPVLSLAQLPTSPSRRQEVALWWQKVFYMTFGSSVSRTGHMVDTCIIVEISFSLTGVTISVSRFIRGPVPCLVMLPPAGDSDDTTINFLPPVRLPTSVPVPAISPPVPVAGAPRAELATGPISTASSDRQLSVAISPCLSRASSAGLSSDDSFFSSGGSSSSLSPTTSSSSEEIEAAHFDEILLDFASPLSPAVSRRAMSPPPSPSASSAAPPIPQMDEAAQRAEAWREEKRRLFARRHKSPIWMRRVGRKLLRRGVVP